MEATLKSKVTEIFSRYHFSSEDAKFIAAVLDEIDERQEQKFLSSKELFLTQPDKVEIIDRIENNKTEINIELNNRINETKIELTEKINEVEKNLNNRINEVEKSLNNRINEVEKSLNNRINEVEQKLTKQIYLVGLVQFLAIVVSLVIILSFMLK